MITYSYIFVIELLEINNDRISVITGMVEFIVFSS